MKKSFLIIIFFIIFVFIFLFYWHVVVEPKPMSETKKNLISKVEIAGKIINVELADTDSKREQGLSGHKPLADDEGMLFVFDQPDKYAFWMKDMLFPIDIIWLKVLPPAKGEDLGGGEVIHIEKNAQPSSYPDSFEPGADAQYVLEVNAGFSEKNSFKIGDRIKFLP